MPVAEPDPYTVLGVARDATDSEIRTAYRMLVVRYHPDGHQGNPLEELAKARMAEINRAYEVLSDPQRRAAFDRGSRAGGFAGGSDRPAGPPRGRTVMKWVVAIFAGVLLLRLGFWLLRMVGGTLAELTAARGTPIALGAALVFLAALVFAFLRRRRR